MNYKESKDATYEQRYNSVKFELFLWNRVSVVELSDGNKVFTRARYVEDELFPELIVRGYNGDNECEEEYSLSCWSKADQKSKDEWKEEYEKTGNSPAYSFSEIEQRVRGYRMELKNILAKMEKEREVDKDGNIYHTKRNHKL